MTTDIADLLVRHGKDESVRNIGRAMQALVWALDSDGEGRNLNLTAAAEFVEAARVAVVHIPDREEEP